MYKITYDFNIIYQKNTNLPIYKILNVDTLKFKDCNIDKGYFESLLEINSIDMQNIVFNVFKGEVIYKLPEQIENWLVEYEKNVLLNDCLYDNDLCFCVYMFYKMKTLGFDDNFSKLFLKSYFINRDKPNTPSHKAIVTKLQEKETNRQYYVISDIDIHKEKETEFFKKLIYSKIENVSEFKFEKFENEYLNLAKKSYSVKNFKINKNNGLPFKRNLELTVEYFNRTQNELLKNAIEHISKQYNISVLEDTFSVSIINNQLKILESLIKLITQ